MLEPEQLADTVIEALREERFWVLPHPEVATYVRRKADDVDRWLAGMRRFQGRLVGDRTRPGDWLVRDRAEHRRLTGVSLDRRGRRKPRL